jgi:5-methylcytosine-specific restriction endonuclease McrA
MSDEQSPQKRCCTCGETKSIELFSRNKSEKDGRQKRCKACVSKHYAENAEAVCARVRAYARANAEVIRERKRGYYKNNLATYKAYAERNAGRIRAYRRAYNEKNAERRSAHQRAYAAANPDARFESQQKYYYSNAEKILAKLRAKYAADPDKMIAIGHNRRARIKGNGGTYTSAEIKAMRLAQAGICTYCQYQHEPDELTIDHIIPVKQGGSNYISNICLACDRCNKSKNNRTREQWTNRWYLRED